MIGIYKITSPSGRIYIGQSNNIEKRWYKYKNLKCQSQPAIYRSLLKYGPLSHLYEIVEICNLNDLNNKERYWQDYYNVLQNGLNCHLTSSNDKKMILSEKTKLKISNTLKEKYIIKEDNPNYKRKHSLEARKNMSLSGKTKVFTKTHKKNLSDAAKNRKQKDVSKEKLSLIRKLNPTCARLIINLDTGIFYDTIMDAAIAYNINYNTLKTRLRKENNNFNFKRL